VQRRKGFQQTDRTVRTVPPLHAAGLSQRSCEKIENPENPRPQVVDLQMRFFAVRRVLPIFSQLQRDNRYR